MAFPRLTTLKDEGTSELRQIVTVVPIPLPKKGGGDGGEVEEVEEEEDEVEDGRRKRRKHFLPRQCNDIGLFDEVDHENSRSILDNRSIQKSCQIASSIAKPREVMKGLRRRALKDSNDNRRGNRSQHPLIRREEKREEEDEEENKREEEREGVFPSSPLLSSP